MILSIFLVLFVQISGNNKNGIYLSQDLVKGRIGPLAHLAFR